MALTTEYVGRFRQHAVHLLFHWQIELVHPCCRGSSYPGIWTKLVESKG